MICTLASCRMERELKRSRSEICAWIVQECCVSRRKTHIMYKGNLSFSQANMYLERLLSSGLIVSENGRYRATEKGLEFLSAYRQLISMLQAPTAHRGQEDDLSSSPKYLLSRRSRVMVEVANPLQHH